MVAAMQGKLYLFGTGKISRKYTEFFQKISIEIEGYVDNDKNKWGTHFCNKKIYSPSVLQQIESPCIFIACAAEEEISSQLVRMHLAKHIVSMSQIICSRSQKIVDMAYVGEPKTNRQEDMTIVIDNLNGTWGGAEDWSHIVALSLLDRKYEVSIVEHIEQPRVDGLEKNTVYINMRTEDEYRIYMNLVRILLRKKPFILFNVRNSELLWAAVAIKQVYPDEVYIISSILNDAIYEKFYEWDDSVDLYLCISSRIQGNLVNLHRVDKRKVHCCTPFIETIRKVNKTYNIKNTEPLKIGYPCRLVDYQKRADLIPKLIMYLEDKNVNYLLNIAGDGPCEKIINEYVEKKHLQAKVKVHGKLSRVALYDFLNRQDVYLNFSEFEGTSLTMLEAMASGCVPVVTNVSGVSDFIENGVNGLIVDVGDLEAISECIVFLDQNRSKLEEYGCKSMRIVQKKCKLSDYMDDIENMIDFKQDKGAK